MQNETVGPLFPFFQNLCICHSVFTFICHLMSHSSGLGIQVGECRLSQAPGQISSQY